MLSCSPISSFIMIKKALNYRVGMKCGYEFRKQGERIENDAASLPRRDGVSAKREDLWELRLARYRKSLGCFTAWTLMSFASKPVCAK